MADAGIGTLSSGLRGRRFPIRLILSYIFDWLVCFVFVGIGGYLDRVAPAKRPFSLVDPNISYPFADPELVPAYLLFILAIGVPVVIVAVVSLIFVPGATVPKGTPKSLIWQRKLWELHVGILGLVLSLTLSWFFTSSMKNLFGKPRPDLLARCEPDWDNLKDHIVGGYSWGSMTGQLVSATICQQKDKYKIDDGFRSYPSGHSSTAAGGLIYASLFMASKFAVTIPFVMPSAASAAGAAAHAAFPSRIQTGPVVDPYEPSRARNFDGSYSSTKVSSDNPGQENAKVQSLRRQAAAPPIYLLALGLVPFGCSIFIAGSRWHDRRHHGFDILFGYLMGLVAAVFAFRFYHLPIRAGAGWAWGPRSDERAFWAGVGRPTYAGTDEELGTYAPQRNVGVSNATSYPPMTSAVAQRNVRQSPDQEPRPSQNFQDVELQRMDDSDRLENRFPDSHYPDSHYPDNRYPDTHYAENRV
ncbi:hypothetical protein NW762_001021 [Fusarium torreyae]|uniref:Phosphatidic acid phosphatase type 2/haloperoxidase domain-containing protein n=1 Tax=Fusarium torreyae TaxID=1237075 RepID=A0A9W8SHG3_9HYPO|nr:hypothetical protein NW762_001021 [Fusarium torreyae]